jgi:hypothetical protein
MKKVNIKHDSVLGRFITTFEDGSVFGKGMYPTEAGAHRAVSRMGFTYDKRVVEKAPKKSSKKASGIDWKALVSASGHGDSFWAAFNNGKASVNGYVSKVPPPEGYTVQLCTDLYKWALANKGLFLKSEGALVIEPVVQESVQVELLEVSGRERLESTIKEVNVWNAQAANEKARLLGYEGKRPFRQLNREFKNSKPGTQERRNLELSRGICIRAATAA